MCRRAIWPFSMAMGVIGQQAGWPDPSTGACSFDPIRCFAVLVSALQRSIHSYPLHISFYDILICFRLGEDFNDNLDDVVWSKERAFRPWSSFWGLRQGVHSLQSYSDVEWDCPYSEINYHLWKWWNCSPLAFELLQYLQSPKTSLQYLKSILCILKQLDDLT